MISFDSGLMRRCLAPKPSTLLVKPVVLVMMLDCFLYCNVVCGDLGDLLCNGNNNNNQLF